MIFTSLGAGVVVRLVTGFAGGGRGARIGAAVGVVLVVGLPAGALDPLGLLLALGANVSFAAGVVLTRHLPAPPDRIVMATGEAGGAYAAFGEAYRRRRMFNAIDKLLGRLSGRLSYVTVLGGTAFSTLSGSSMGSTALLGRHRSPGRRRRVAHRRAPGRRRVAQTAHRRAPGATTG